MKWKAYPEDVLPLWVAEMDVMPAEPIARAIKDAVDLGDTGYPSGTAYAEALQVARTSLRAAAPAARAVIVTRSGARS